MDAVWADNSLDRWIDDLHANRLPDKRRRMPFSAAQQPEPEQKSVADYARDVIAGFRSQEPFINPASYPPFLIVSKTILPDKNTAHKVTQVLNALLKQDISDRFGIALHEVKLFPHIKESRQGVEFGYGAYYQQQLQNVKWDDIAKEIKDTPRGFGGRW